MSDFNVWIQKAELRYLLFTFICFGYFAYGCNITLIGVAFQDLTAILGVDSRNISYGITIRYVVNCLAAILGQTLAPLIVRPYLSTQTTNNSLSINQIRESSKIQIPFLICAVPFLIVFLFIFICYFVKPYKSPKRFIESKDIILNSKNMNENEVIVNDQNNQKDQTFLSPLPRYYYHTFIVIISLILAFEIVNELNLNFYLPSYLNKSDLHIDQKTISLMMSSIGFLYCLGRFLYILIALKVDVLIMLYINLVLIVAGNLALTFATYSHLKITWLAVGFLGLGYSSLFPCLFSFIETRITITNNLNSFLVFVTSSVFAIDSLMIGDSIDSNPSLFRYLNSIFSVLFVILFVILHSTDLWKKKLLKNFIT